MKSGFILSTCLVFACVAFPAQLANPKSVGMDPLRLAAIPERMKQFVDSGATAGIVTLVARHGKIVALDAVGYADIERKDPMRTNSLFRIASLTKPITCAAIMILVDEGEISLIDPIEKYLPGYKGLKLNPCGSLSGYNCASVDPARAIDIEDLMVHTSGLPGSVDYPDDKPPASLADLVNLGSKEHLLFEPGAAWDYSNLGYDILGRIVEIVSGHPFDQFLADRIFKPLGMNETWFFVPPAEQSRVASLYKPENGKLVRVDAPLHQSGIPSPAGGLVSSATDIFRFNEMMRNKGSFDGRRILSKAAVESMITSHTGDIPSGWAPGVGHGYGYEVVRDAAGIFRYNSIGSFVKGGAYRTYESVDPARDLVCVLMMQRSSSDGDVAQEINVFLAMAAAAVED